MQALPDDAVSVALVTGTICLILVLLVQVQTSAQPAAVPSAQLTTANGGASAQPITADGDASAQPITADGDANTVATANDQPAQANGYEQQDVDMAEEENSQELEISDMFQPGTVLHVTFEPTEGQSLPTEGFRSIRVPFGGLEGGVKHADYRNVRASRPLSPVQYNLC